ncbi:unnamed protein product [Trichobilharzia regenti]|nr:unnamed protein product [Trichobilharzia regenti]
MKNKDNRMRNNNLNNNNNSNSHSNYKINDKELNWFTVSLTKYYLTNNNNEYNQTSRNMPTTKLTNPNDSLDKLGRQFTELARDVLKNYSIVESFGRKDLYAKKALTRRTAIKTHLSPPTSSSSASSTSSDFNTPVRQHRRQKKSIVTKRNNNNNHRLEEVNTRWQLKQSKKSMTIHMSKMDKVKEKDSLKVKTADGMTTPQSSTDSLMNTMSIECHTPQVFNHPSEPIINRDKLKESSSTPSSSSASSLSVSSITSPTSTSKFDLKTEKVKSTDNEKCQTKVLRTDFDEESIEMNEAAKDKQKAKASSSAVPSSSTPTTTTTPAATTVSSTKSTDHQSRRNHQHQTYQFVGKSETSSGQTKLNKSRTAAYCDNETLNSKSSSGIGFYRILNTVGSGNFSQVKSAMHVLTKGK